MITFFLERKDFDRKKFESFVKAKKKRELEQTKENQRLAEIEKKKRGEEAKKKDEIAIEEAVKRIEEKEKQRRLRAFSASSRPLTQKAGYTRLNITKKSRKKRTSQRVFRRLKKNISSRSGAR
jgi:hypothetical protein